jgi:hypothetical protein
MGVLGNQRRRAYLGLVGALTALALAMAGALVSPASAGGYSHRLHAGTKKVDRNTKITSFVTGHTASGRTVVGKFVPKRFMMSGDQLVAQGVLKGKIKRPGPDRKFTKRGVVLPVYAVNGAKTAAPSGARANAAFPPSPGAGACNVLNLVLGPLDLNVLGLLVHLDTVTLNIVAQSGAGQLLGNLLCAVAGLLDGGGPLSGLLGQLNTLLTQILGALGGLRA